MRWITSQRNLKHAPSVEERADITRNNEVEHWAKKAAQLPLPEVDPTSVGHIIVDRGHAPTPAGKCVTACWASMAS